MVAVTSASASLNLGIKNFHSYKNFFEYSAPNQEAKSIALRTHDTQNLEAAQPKFSVPIGAE